MSLWDIKVLKNADDDFPPIEQADEDGLLAIGGDLSETRLLDAYSKGIFPWFSDESPILWWSPDPRFMMKPSEVHVSKSMQRLFKRKSFKVTLDTCFSDVIQSCALVPRQNQDGTWITSEMQQAYINLHEKGYVHSVEVWNEAGKLVGGLYGLSLGAMFCGESMFSLEKNASKYGFLTLASLLQEREFEIIDAQVYTPHLESLGAYLVPRSDFLKKINAALKKETLVGKWIDWTR